MDTTPRNLITRAEAARRAGVDLRTVARWLADNKITRYADGFGRVRVDADELDRMLTPVPRQRNAS